MSGIFRPRASSYWEFELHTEVVEECMLLSGHGHRAIPLDTLVSLTAAEALVLQIG